MGEYDETPADMQGAALGSPLGLADRALLVVREGSQIGSGAGLKLGAFEDVRKLASE